MNFTAFFALLVVAVVVIVNRIMTPWRGGIEINHVFTFSFGLVSYWIFPVLVGSIRPFTDNIGLKFWYQIYDGVPNDLIIAFLSYSLVAFLSFCCGSLMASKIYRHRRHWLDLSFDKRTLYIPFIIWSLVSVTYLLLLRSRLFGGYAALSPLDPSFVLVGSLTAGSIGMLGVALIYSLKTYQEQPTSSFKSLFANGLFNAYWIVAVLLASLGGRLYLASSVLMILITRSVYFKRSSFRSLGVLAVFGVAAAGVVGIFRIGGSVSSDALATNISAEPLFTSISLLSSLTQNIDDMFRFPAMLLSGLLNIIPAALFPDKGHYMVLPEAYGFNIQSPFGAMNNYVSLMLNFGSMGSLIFLFALGFLLSRLKEYDKNLLYRVMYIMLSAWLAFTFFRDGFEISLDKTMLEMSILMPFASVVFAQYATNAIKMGRQSPTISVHQEGSTVEEGNQIPVYGLRTIASTRPLASTEETVTAASPDSTLTRGS